MHTWIVFIYEEINEATGNEAYYVIQSDPLIIKKLTSDLEDESELGRLFDMDVLRPNGEKVDRAELGLSPRRCLICGGPAKECARSHTHTVEQLQERTLQILTKAMEGFQAKKAASLACRALLYEVCTTPKPGLVDRSNSGSHQDMDVFTFISSASALWPYFETCTRIGMATAKLPAPETFLRLRSAGKKAEADMFSATGGVNTHKGAIFSVGILCAALGRLPEEQWKIPDKVLLNGRRTAGCA
ncbi:MAG: citrate lyase holo-[acyl-carrier protein] synthase [Eubacteriales bacterium]|nr:citrate lyase holo-[acyl-carrier protein] synthase [Eubacteriales bacterium]